MSAAPVRSGGVDSGAAAPPIRARATRFDLSATPVHWVPGDAQTTHTINVLHLFLPPGERWFCDVYRDALPLITDPQLRADARGFVGQEATHAKAHDGGLEMLARQGIDLRREVARADRIRIGARKVIRKLPPGLRRRVLTAELGAIAAIEHFTAVLGVWVIEDSVRLDEVGADPAMVDLLRWHGAEEVEHRAVAFDIFEHLGGSYARRAFSMAVAAVGLTAAWMAATQVLMRLDPDTAERAHWRTFREAGEDGRLPMFRSIVDSIPGYLRRDHHPSQVGHTELALAYLATSPGVAHRP
ncbi:MAG TPA: metal-dependent hydrolase [Acidimicrobiales bacterium]|nr:metal-dependent hydrolase [Acidimicrobiales bacterium]